MKNRKLINYLSWSSTVYIVLIFCIKNNELGMQAGAFQLFFQLCFYRKDFPQMWNPSMLLVANLAITKLCKRKP